MSLIKTTQDNKYFGKKWEFETNSMGAVALFALVVLFLGYFCYLNYSAIMKSTQFYVGIHPIVTIVGLFAVSFIIKKVYGEVGKVVSQAMWITMGVIGMFWVLTTSDWATYQKVILVFCHLLAYANLSMNALSSNK